MTAVSYEYFILGSVVPIRVTCNQRGGWISAERPDDVTGELIIAHTLMSRLRDNWEVEEIDADRFEQLRRAFPERTAARYRYFTLGESNPVRVSYNAHGWKMGAEWVDPATGKLTFNNALLARLEQNWDADEINADEFDRLCRATTRLRP